MNLLVMDASALVELLLQTPRASRVEPFFASTSYDVHVPALVDVEVTSALRRGLLDGALDLPRAQQALEDLAELPSVSTSTFPSCAALSSCTRTSRPMTPCTWHSPKSCGRRW